MEEIRFRSEIPIVPELAPDEADETEIVKQVIVSEDIDPPADDEPLPF